MLGHSEAVSVLQRCTCQRSTDWLREVELKHSASEKSKTQKSRQANITQPLPPRKGPGSFGNMDLD